MGKKGKRSRRKAVNATDRASMDDLQTKVEELLEKVGKSRRMNLFSQAVDELREGIQLIETKMLEMRETMIRTNSQVWFVETKLIFYSNLISIELDRYNFDGAIQSYKENFERGTIDLNMKNLSPAIPSLKLQYHEALLRQGKGDIGTFISLSKLRITHPIKHDDSLKMDSFRSALKMDLFRSANILRTTKHFDAAIEIGKQLKELTTDRLSLVTTYLEQYIVGDKSIPVDFVSNMVQVMDKYENGGYDTGDACSMLVLAQWTYLFRQFDNTEVIIRKAIGFIEEYLDMISRVEPHCITCTQTATESEVQFVCSGCRVACYCSIDHQRMTWKKEVVRGMRFGHDILCPVMKAYRKWRHANDNGDNKRISRLRLHFERECSYLLSDGLGLKDKCFQTENIEQLFTCV